MSLIRGGDPLEDYRKWEHEEYWAQQALPVCEVCGEPITDEYAYRINGELWCKYCINDAREWIDE